MNKSYRQFLHDPLVLRLIAIELIQMKRTERVRVSAFLTLLSQRAPRRWIVCQQYNAPTGCNEGRTTED